MGVRDEQLREGAGGGGAPGRYRGGWSGGPLPVEYPGGYDRLGAEALILSSPYGDIEYTQGGVARLCWDSTAPAVAATTRGP